MIVARYEKGNRFLDLVKEEGRKLDDDGTIVIDEYWICQIFGNEGNPDEHTNIRFFSKTLAELFIEHNQWKEQSE